MIINDLESRALNLLLAGDHPALAVLRRQMASVVVSRREFTGVGFLTDFLVGDAPRLGQARLQLGDVGATAPGLRNGIGFVLFVENGAIATIEAHTYDEPLPDDLCECALFYTGGGCRDMTSLGAVLDAYCE